MRSNMRTRVLLSLILVSIAVGTGAFRAKYLCDHPGFVTIVLHSEQDAFPVAAMNAATFVQVGDRKYPLFYGSDAKQASFPMPLQDFAALPDDTPIQLTFRGTFTLDKSRRRCGKLRIYGEDSED